MSITKKIINVYWKRVRNGDKHEKEVRVELREIGWEITITSITLS